MYCTSRGLYNIRGSFVRAGIKNDAASGSNQKAPRRACQGLGPRRFDSTRLQRARVNEVSCLWFGYTAQNSTILSCTMLYSGGSELTRPAVGASALNLNWHRYFLGPPIKESAPWPLYLYHRTFTASKFQGLPLQVGLAWSTEWGLLQLSAKPKVTISKLNPWGTCSEVKHEHPEDWTFF